MSRWVWPTNSRLIDSPGKKKQQKSVWLVFTEFIFGSWNEKKIRNSTATNWSSFFVQSVWFLSVMFEKNEFWTIEASVF